MATYSSDRDSSQADNSLSSRPVETEFIETKTEHLFSQQSFSNTSGTWRVLYASPLQTILAARVLQRSHFHPLHSVPHEDPGHLQTALLEGPGYVVHEHFLTGHHILLVFLMLKLKKKIRFGHHGYHKMLQILHDK